MLQWAEGRGLAQSPVLGMAHVGLGELLYEWNDLGAATTHLCEGIARGRQGGEMKIMVAGHLALAFVHQAQGRGEEALATVRAAAGWGQPARVAATRARLLLLQGRVAQ